MSEMVERFGASSSNASTQRPPFPCAKGLDAGGAARGMAV
jgi:hypothetical protein